MVKLTEDIRENFPFISVVHYGDQEYVGVLINQDQWVTSMYDFELLRTEEEKRRLLELGEIWWWESNRLIPISIFLRQEMVEFRYCIFTMNTKDVEVVLGPTVNLHNMTAKRAKRKLIQMVRKR
jgi:hypothetical protein